MRQDLLRRFKQWAGWGIPVAFLPQWDTNVPSLNSLKKRKSLGTPRIKLGSVGTLAP